MIYEINHIWTAEMEWQWRNDSRSERNLCNCVKKPLKNSGPQRGLNPWPRDTGAILYQLSYEATDVGSRSIFLRAILRRTFSRLLIVEWILIVTCRYFRFKWETCIHILVIFCIVNRFIFCAFITNIMRIWSFYECLRNLKLLNYYYQKSLPEGLTKPLMHAVTSTLGVSGSDRGLHFSI